MVVYTARKLKLSLTAAPVTIHVGCGGPVVGRVHRPVQAVDNIAPCSSAAGCPIGIRIRELALLVREKKLREAWEVLKSDNPFPAITGRVCYRPCEDACNRGRFDESVAIGAAVERFVGDFGLGLREFAPPPEKREKIAIVGSGPAGLSAAYFLAQGGYRVTIFEKLPMAGGMLVAGIPGYRLPRSVLEAEIGGLERLGVEIRVDCPVGTDPSLAQLQGSYDAVLVATGAHAARALSVPGETAMGVLDGMSLLRQTNLEGRAEVGHRVAVIGGGNVAIDAARCCLRLGAREVTILYRRSREEMRAHDEEVAAAQAEGIGFAYHVEPAAILTRDNRVVGVRLTKTRPGESDAGTSSSDLEQSGVVMDVDTVVVAIGQAVDSSFLRQTGLDATPEGLLAAAPGTSTSAPKVFAAGDAVTGPKTVAHAIAAGKQAALAIDADLQGRETARAQLRHVVSFQELNTDYFVRRERVVQRTLTLQQRLSGFAEVNLDLGEEAAMYEARRCFVCGLCNNCGVCSSYCPEGIIAQGVGTIDIEIDFCKGCGICVTECPRSAIKMEMEA